MTKDKAADPQMAYDALGGSPLSTPLRVGRWVGRT